VLQNTISKRMSYDVLFCPNYRCNIVEVNDSRKHLSHDA